MAKTLFTLLLFMATLSLQAQSPIGVWQNKDDKTGEPKAHIKIYKEDGLLYGKIIKLLQSPDDTVCENCPGDKKNKKLVGMEILWELKKDGDEWNSGQIMDPESGKVYKCLIELEDADTLRVRGYIGWSALGRNQYWERI